MLNNLFITSSISCSLALLSLLRTWGQTTVLPEIWLLLLFVPSPIFKATSPYSCQPVLLATFPIPPQGVWELLDTFHITLELRAPHLQSSFQNPVSNFVYGILWEDRGMCLSIVASLISLFLLYPLALLLTSRGQTLSVLCFAQYSSVNECRFHRILGEGILHSNGEKVIYN